MTLGWDLTHFAILELDPIDQLLDPDSVRLAMRMAVRHVFVGRRDSAAKGTYLELGKQGVSSPCHHEARSRL